MKLNDWTARIVEDLRAVGITPSILQGLPVVYVYQLPATRDIKQLGDFVPSVACDLRYSQKANAILFLPRNTLKGLMP